MIIPPRVEPFYFTEASVVVPAEESRFTPLRQQQMSRYAGKFLQVRVRSATNLAQLAEQGQLNVGVAAWFCEIGDSLRLGGPAELRYRDAQVGYIDVPRMEREHVRSLIAEIPERQAKTYHFYLDPKAYLHDEHFSSHSEYDLDRDLRDVCVKIRGGGFFTPGFNSNVVVIPKEAIRAAFDRSESSQR
jgi:hypothetical protein